MSNLSPFEQYVGVPILRLHDLIYQKTNGRIGHRVPGVPPSLLLHTVGAKTGQPRTTSLTYARDGDSYLIVASNGGGERYPGWYHNLRKHPECEINVGPKRFAVTARRITP
jgi:F420H(2)-dependent quinone reductase